MDWNLEHAIVDYQDDLREACNEEEREPMSIIDMVKRIKFCADEIERLTERSG